MKKRFRILAALLALALLAGCGDSSGSSNSSSGADSSASGSDSSVTSSDTGDESSESAAQAGEVTLPISDETVTVTMWTPMDSNTMNIIDNMGESEFFQELEAKTNVHIEFDHPAIGNETTAFNLLIASGDLPDMIKNGSNYTYPDGLDAAVNDGYYLDLTDLAEEYLPNYLAAIDNYASYDDNYRRACYTNENRMVGVYQIMTEPQGAFSGLYVREDWLKEAGLDTPVTYDDWENMLTVFKDDFGASAPYILSAQGYDAANNSMSAGFGVSCSFYQEDGTVKYGPVEEGWKEYVSLMADWYSKGLIDPDYMTGSYFPDEAMITTGKTGAFNSMYTLIAMYEASNEDPDATYIPVSAPKVNPEDTVKLNMYSLGGGYITISQKSENVETCLKLLDYMFSEEGSLFANYGAEGDTFEYDDEGTPQYTEKITANSEGLSFSQAMAYYTMPPARVSLQDWKRELASVPEKDLVCYDVWGEATTENAMADPTAYGMTVEENTEYAKIMADINTIVEERTNQFITGAVSLDEYDAFVDSLHQMNIDRAIEIVQTVYDRFEAR